ncbi:tyrosine-protein phosphatase [Microbacterium caowuchunii]|uniref:Tyrosine-protein phosphatase n=1 Tax=Microbacterium caowuchunii TaxID=2614638 RepID=A0A5N0TM25_9MICO|nr:tyrosine-protein phosphatase [Microbacterium caowuchunii]KAA9134399.1 tyrosine-protein phosphatase [Microbacterium caowuchunii]
MTNATILSATSPERRILTSGTFQGRDAGRYPTTDGRWMRGGVLFRSDALANLDSDDLKEFDELGIRLVIDLREKIEADAAKDLLPEGVAYRRIPVFEETLFSHDFNAFPTLLGQYQLILDGHAPRLAEVIAAIADTDGAALVHCTAGKDRTGLVVALIQLLLGIDEEIVLADYGASQIILGAEFDGAVRDLYSRAGLPGAILGTDPHKAPPTYLAETLAELRRRHGSVGEFLVAHGLTHAQINALRDRFLTV